MLAQLIILYIASLSEVHCTKTKVPKDIEDTFWMVQELNQPQKQLTFDNIQYVISTKIEKLVFITHGWHDSKNSGWYDAVSEGILQNNPTWAVILVDWSGPAKSQDYQISHAHVPVIGRNLGKFIAKIMENCQNINGDEIILIGHSLGSHVSGFAGKYVESTGGKISRIIGLDPASGLWTGNPCDNRLCKTDAKYVSIIHTDIGRGGMPEAIGHSDFYPNYGANQPGCMPSPTEITAIHICNHFRAIRYFIEAAKHPSRFLASKCFNNTDCVCDSEKAHMGSLTEESEGIFFLETNAEPPFSLTE